MSSTSCIYQELLIRDTHVNLAVIWTFVRDQVESCLEKSASSSTCDVTNRKTMLYRQEFSNVYYKLRESSTCVKVHAFIIYHLYSMHQYHNHMCSYMYYNNHERFNNVQRGPLSWYRLSVQRREIE